jgi:hypothetical protein
MDESVAWAIPRAREHAYGPPKLGGLPIERRVRDVLAIFPPIAREGLLETLTSEDSAERARVIGRLYAAPQVRALAELLIDIETEPAMRVFVVGMLRDFDPRYRSSP